MVMTLLIAMEFKHSIIRVALRRSSIVQVKTIMLISLIALGRKFVILDTKATSASTIAALAGATLVLGVVYWRSGSATIASQVAKAVDLAMSESLASAPNLRSSGHPTARHVCLLRQGR